MKTMVVRGDRVYTLKEGVDIDDFLGRHPDILVVKGKKPGIRALMEWEEAGYALATDGCKVEADGHCPHGHPSWLLALGYI